jgi:hypothetical protein
MSRWLAATLVLGCWGCAFSLDGPDPNRPRNRVPQCDTSKGLVALDGVMATALGVMALSLTSESEPGLALLPLGFGALYLAGAVSGNRTANACKAAIEDYTRTYGDERMVAEDDGDDAPSVYEDPRAKPRSKRSAGQAPGAPQGYGPQQGYPAPNQGYPDPYQKPTAPRTQPPGAAPQPPVVQPPQMPQQPTQAPAQPAKPRQPKAPPPPPPEPDDWADFWREVP